MSKVFTEEQKKVLLNIRQTKWLNDKTKDLICENYINGFLSNNAKWLIDLEEYAEKEDEKRAERYKNFLLH